MRPIRLCLAVGAGSLAILVVGCGAPAVPAHPAWADVAPIVRGNCVGCHGWTASDRPPNAAGVHPPNTGGGLRLDFYDVTEAVCGDAALAMDPERSAGGLGAASCRRSRPISWSQPGAQVPRMPPEPYPSLESWELQTIERWASDPVKGLPPPGNRPPTIATNRLPATVDQQLAFTAILDDPDGDSVIGVVEVPGLDLLMNRPGSFDVVFDSSELAAGPGLPDRRAVRRMDEHDSRARTDRRPALSASVRRQPERSAADEHGVSLTSTRSIRSRLPLRARGGSTVSDLDALLDHDLITERDPPMAGEVDGERSRRRARRGILGDPFAGREHPAFPRGTSSRVDAEGGAAERGEAREVRRQRRDLARRVALDEDIVRTVVVELDGQRRARRVQRRHSSLPRRSGAIRGSGWVIQPKPASPGSTSQADDRQVLRPVRASTSPVGDERPARRPRQRGMTAIGAPW